MSAVTDFLKTDFSGREKLDDTDLRREDANRQKYENQDLEKHDAKNVGIHRSQWKTFKTGNLGKFLVEVSPRNLGKFHEFSKVDIQNY